MSTQITSVHRGKKAHECSMCNKTFQSNSNTYTALAHEGKKLILM